MTVRTYATATSFQRIQMIEDALEKVLDRGGSMSVEKYAAGEAMHVFVLESPFDDHRVAFSLYQIARELEGLLP